MSHGSENTMKINKTIVILFLILCSTINVIAFDILEENQNLQTLSSTILNKIDINDMGFNNDYNYFTEQNHISGTILVVFHHVDSELLAEFINDYSQYELFRLYGRRSEWIYYRFHFNTTLIDEKVLLEMIQNDERVFSASFDNKFIWGRYVEVLLHNLADYQDFYSDYSTHFRRLLGWRFHNPNYILTFERNIPHIEEPSLVHTIKNDERVFAAWPAIDLVPGEIIVFFYEDSPIEIDVLIEDFFEDYHIYNLTVLLYPISPRFRTFLIGYDFGVLAENDIANIFREDERVRSVMLNYMLYLGGNPDPPINIFDDPILNPQFTVFSYPNPAKTDFVNIKITDSTSNLSPFTRSDEIMIDIYNIRGQLVKTSTDFQLINQENLFVWDKKDKNNTDVPSGVYFYRVQLRNDVATGKITIIK